MITVDLVTGFLGAGKTTFIKKYVEYLKRQNEKVRIIENEFGSESVDSYLLDDECEVSELAGLCMCCVGKDAFIKMLIQSADAGCDRIIVEPSGIYDVDEFFEVMSLPRVAEKCEIGSIITIVDLMELDYLLDEAEYLLFTQVLSSGVVLVSKRDLIDDLTYKNGLTKLNKLMTSYGCENGVLADIIAANIEEISDDVFNDISESSYSRLIHDRQEFVHSEVFQSALVNAYFKDEQDIRDKISAIYDNPSCGRVYRIKGFKKIANNRVYEINSTCDNIAIRPSNETEDLLVVIGQYLRVADIEAKLKE